MIDVQFIELKKDEKEREKKKETFSGRTYIYTNYCLLKIDSKKGWKREGKENREKKNPLVGEHIYLNYCLLTIDSRSYIKQTFI